MARTTVDEQQKHRDLLDHAKDDGHSVVTVPDRIRAELSETADVDGNQIRDVTVYETEYNDSFEFDWVDESALTTEEVAAWESRDEDIVGRPQNYEYCLASQFRATDDGQIRGLHEPEEQRIIIHRDVLSDHTEFIGVWYDDYDFPDTYLSEIDGTAVQGKHIGQVLGERYVDNVEAGIEATSAHRELTRMLEATAQATSPT